MSTTSSSTISTTSLPIPNGPNIIVLSPSQITTRLTNMNFPAWRVQMTTIFIGYNLFSFLDGTKSCPSLTDLDYNTWKRQDQLLLHFIISSISDTIVIMLGSVKSSKEAWDLLATMFANKSRTRLMSLKEHLINLSKGELSIADYLQQIKTIADEISIINSPLDDTDLVIHTLNGLPSDYREIAAAIRARESLITFQELHEKLMDHESYLSCQTKYSAASVVSVNTAQKLRPSSFRTRYSNNNQRPSSASASIPPSRYHKNSNSRRVVC